jgi:hypothetical protein
MICDVCGHRAVKTSVSWVGPYCDESCEADGGCAIQICVCEIPAHQSGAEQMFPERTFTCWCLVEAAHAHA